MGSLYILLGRYGTDLFLKKYSSEIYNAQIAADGFTLNFSDKKNYTNPSITIIEDLLLSLKPDEFIVLSYKNEFIQVVLSKSDNSTSKMFHVEYFNEKKDTLFEVSEQQNLSNTIKLFKLFMLQDQALLNEIKWVDSGITYSDKSVKTNTINIKLKTRPILSIFLCSIIYIIILSPSFIYIVLNNETQAVKLENTSLTVSVSKRSKHDAPSLKLLEEKLYTMKLGDGDYITYDTPNGFMQTYLDHSKSGDKYYQVEYRLYPSDNLYISKEKISQVNMLNLFRKFYNQDDSYKTDIVWNIINLKENQK
jgi:hypothetical protein